MSYTSRVPGDGSQEIVADMLVTQKEATICGYEVKCLTPIRNSWREWKKENTHLALALPYIIATTVIVLAILGLIGYQTGFFEQAGPVIQQWLSSVGLTNGQVFAITGATGVGFLALLGLIKYAVNRCSKKPTQEETVHVPTPEEEAPKVTNLPTGTTGESPNPDILGDQQNNSLI